MRVDDPAGRAWRVRRRWIPHRDGKGARQRFKRRTTDWLHGLDLPFDIADGLAGIVLAIAAVVVIALLLILGWPLILLGLDLLWLLLVFSIGLLGRLALRRPWRVEAVSSIERREWFVKGFVAAGRTRDEIADLLVRGHNSPGEVPHLVQQSSR